MVALLVRLKLALVANGLKRSAWQVVALVLGSLYGVLIVGLLAIGMVAVSFEDAALRGAVTTLVGALLVFGWWMVPLVAFGVDSTLDSARFAVFGIPRRQLLAGLGVAALVGVPGVLTVVAAVSLVVAWWRTPAALFVALVGSVLGVALAVVGGRAVAESAGPLLSGRRAREVAAVAVVLVLVAIGPVVSLLGGGTTEVELGPDLVERASRALAWTPWGAPFSAPAAAAQGQWAVVLARLAIGGAALALMVWVWDRAISRSFVRPAGGDGPTSRPRGLGWFGRLPATPLGAIWARCLTYWTRDPRYGQSIIIAPFMPVVLWLVARDGDLLLASGPLVAFLLGWGLSADVSYDGTAFWTHLSAPIRGSTDRLGRVLGSALIAAPIVVVVTVVTAVVADGVHHLPALLGASVGVLLTAWGGSSIASALVVYPVQRAGDNPFATKQGTSAAGIVSQLAGWSLVFAAALPELVLAALAVGGDLPAAGIAAAVVGPALGAVALTVGVRVGGRILDQRGPLLQQRMMSFT